MANKSVTQLGVLPTIPESSDAIHVVRSGVDYQTPYSNFSVYQRVEIVISSAEFLASFTTPITVVAAQGAGTYTMVKSATLINLAGGTTAYNTGARASFLSNSDRTNNFGELSNACTESAAQYIIDMESLSGDQIKENQSIVFSTGIADPTLGDHTFKLVVYYTIESF